jgi:hypothetical protein
VEVLGRGGPAPGCVDGHGACPPEDCGGPGERIGSANLPGMRAIVNRTSRRTLIIRRPSIQGRIRDLGSCVVA